MKFSLSWLKAHLDTSSSLEALSQGLTACGLEVENIEAFEYLDPMVVGRIADAKPHPHADRLVCCSVDVGAGQHVDVVCGDPAARTGLLSIFAPVGAYVPGLDMVLRRARIRSVESHGMLCSAHELGLTRAGDGIVQLTADFPPGTPAKVALGVDDPILNVSVTPNRPDCLGVRGIARDLAARGLGRLLDSQTPAVHEVGACPLDLDVLEEARPACPLVSLRAVLGVDPGAETPGYVRDRLRVAGVRATALPVDITNYICFDRSRPLHAYDLDKIVGPMCVRLSKKGEVFDGLDGVRYALPGGLCVVADDMGILALAGIMGGVRASVQAGTRNVLFESALFSREWVVRSGRAVGIVSESRLRFERGVDPESLCDGLDRAASMLVEHAGGSASPKLSVGQVPVRRTLRFEEDALTRLTGLSMVPAEQKGVLVRLGLRFVDDRTVEVPSYRPDLTEPCDLVGELLRMGGLDRLSSVPMPTGSQPCGADQTIEFVRRKASDVSVALGYLETVGWSFIAGDLARSFVTPAGETEFLSVKNPISTHMSVMRPSLLPGLLANAARDRAGSRKSSALFEVGTQFDRKGVLSRCGEELPETGERLFLSGVRVHRACMDGGERHWCVPSRLVGVLDVKRDVMSILRSVVPAQRFVVSTQRMPDWYHPSASGCVLASGKVVAWFGCPHPRVVESIDMLKGVSTAVFELDLVILAALLLEQKKPAVAPWRETVFQKVTRDFAFVVDCAVAAGDIVGAVKKASPLISDTVIFDVFTHPSLGRGKKSIGVEVTIQPREATLASEQIEAVAQKIIAGVTKATGAQLRV